MTTYPRPDENFLNQYMVEVDDGSGPRQQFTLPAARAHRQTYDRPGLLGHLVRGARDVVPPTPWDPDKPRPDLAAPPQPSTVDKILDYGSVPARMVAGVFTPPSGPERPITAALPPTERSASEDVEYDRRLGRFAVDTGLNMIGAGRLPGSSPPGAVGAGGGGKLGGTVRNAAPIRAFHSSPHDWRTDFPTPGYHGTNQVFTKFRNPPVDMQLDRALGTHIGADPALASSFANRFFPLPGSSRTEIKGAPNVIPVQIPHRSQFLQVDQPILDVYKNSTEPMWRRVATDERQIERMMAKEGYQSDPMMLQRYLQEARAMQPREAEKAARTMAEGGQADVDIGKADLDRFLKNYGGRPYNQADRERMVEIARGNWEGKGHKGLRYINTAPTEAGAPGVVDPTSYIVFNPKNIVSRYGGTVLGGTVAGAAFLPDERRKH